MGWDARRTVAARVLPSRPASCRRAGGGTGGEEDALRDRTSGSDRGL